MPLLVRVVHKDIFILWCLTYLRLLTSATPTGTYAFSLENSKLVWGIASLTSSDSLDLDFKRALLNATLSF